MKKIVAAIIIVMVGCVSVPLAGAQPRHDRSGAQRGGDRGRGAQQRGQRRRRYRGGKWEWYEDPAVGAAVGSFFGNLFRRQQEQATRPGREAEDVQGDEPTDEAELEPWSPGWLAYCKRKYKSFDIKDGRYLSHDGNRYFCK